MLVRIFFLDAPLPKSLENEQLLVQIARGELQNLARAFHLKMYRYLGELDVPGVFGILDISEILQNKINSLPRMDRTMLLGDIIWDLTRGQLFLRGPRGWIELPPRYFENLSFPLQAEKKSFNLLQSQNIPVLIEQDNGTYYLPAPSFTPKFAGEMYRNLLSKHCGYQKNAVIQQLSDELPPDFFTEEYCKPFFKPFSPEVIPNLSCEELWNIFACIANFDPVIDMTGDAPLERTFREVFQEIDRRGEQCPNPLINYEKGEIR